MSPLEFARIPDASGFPRSLNFPTISEDGCSGFSKSHSPNSMEFTRAPEGGGGGFTKAMNESGSFSLLESKDDEKKKLKRQKNNEAVKKCREARRNLERQTADGLERERKRNRNLEKEYDRMATEAQLLKQILPLCSHAKIQCK